MVPGSPLAVDDSQVAGPYAPSARAPIQGRTLRCGAKPRCPLIADPYDRVVPVAPRRHHRCPRIPPDVAVHDHVSASPSARSTSSQHAHRHMNRLRIRGELVAEAHDRPGSCHHPPCEVSLDHPAPADPRGAPLTLAAEPRHRPDADAYSSTPTSAAISALVQIAARGARVADHSGSSDWTRSIGPRVQLDTSTTARSRKNSTTRRCAPDLTQLSSASIIKVCVVIATPVGRGGITTRSPWGTAHPPASGCRPCLDATKAAVSPDALGGGARAGAAPVLPPL